MKNSNLESLRGSLKEEITSEIKGLLIESQKRLLKLKSSENEDEETETTSECEPRNFHAPTRFVRINSAQNNDPNISREKNNKPRTAKVGAISRAQNCKRGPLRLCEIPVGCKI